MSYFQPSPALGRDSRMGMDEALWDSVRDRLVELGESTDAGGDAEAAGPTGLLDYGAYFDITLTPPAENEVSAEAQAAAVRHLQRRLPAIGALDPVAAPPRISNFSADDYTAFEVERMRRWWDIEPANRMAMIQATEEDVARSRRLIAIAMEHLRLAAPEMHEEVFIVVRDIVLSRPDGTNKINYGGASSFALWGALTINTETHHEWIQFYRQIVHEAAHNLLFGIARESPLVLDDPSVRTASPIRADPRPMDGVFHAAFVTAREAYAMDAMLARHEDTGCLDEGDAKIFEDLLEITVLNFWDCIETLRADAEMTELGQAVLAECEAYMNATFAVEPVDGP